MIKPYASSFNHESLASRMTIMAGEERRAEAHAALRLAADIVASRLLEVLASLQTHCGMTDYGHAQTAAM